MRCLTSLTKYRLDNLHYTLAALIIEYCVVLPCLAMERCMGMGWPTSLRGLVIGEGTAAAFGQTD